METERDGDGMTEAAQQRQPSAAELAEQKEKTEFARLLDRSIAIGERGVEIKTLEDLKRLAAYIMDSGFAPKNDKLADVVIKLQAGAEIGFSPIRALSVLTSINGRCGIMGDAARALVQSKGVLKPGTAIVCEIEGAGDARVGVCTTWRKGWTEPQSTRFSVADAKLAKLWGKSGPWSEYPNRMLLYRPLGFHLRDHYSDVLMGLVLAEELRDFPPAAATQEREQPPADTTPDPIFSTEATESANVTA
jgi:hypothetical protein